MLSLITTCKNRLDHLRQTLPSMVRQSFSEVIVVDYGCEQGTAGWVSVNFPGVKLIRVEDDPQFCLARARNIGARHALNDILTFIDADTILNIDLGLWLKDHMHPGQFFVSKDRGVHPDLWGFVVCGKKVFDQVGGYDEAYREWGGEDFDLYERLELLGLKPASVPGESLTPIKHGDGLRQLKTNDLVNFESRNQFVMFNRFYRLVKTDVQHMLQREIDLETRTTLRRRLFEEQTRAMSEGKREIKITIDVPSKHKFVQRQIVYNVEL